jgi:hypothetical protein
MALPEGDTPFSIEVEAMLMIAVETQRCVNNCA